MSRRSVTSLLLVGALALGIAACSSAGGANSANSASGTDNGDGSTTISTAPPTSETTTTAASGEAVREAAVTAALKQAAAAGVPNAQGAVVVLSTCNGGTSVAHLGYYNNDALSGPITEPDGAVVPVGAICINPQAPDLSSVLLANLGHKYFWEKGLWAQSKTDFGSPQRAGECFAKAFGATTFESGGCSDADAQRVRVMLGI
jgi:hypothetical protein